MNRKIKVVVVHNGTYVNMQYLMQVQGKEVITGVPARYICDIVDELNLALSQAKTFMARTRTLEEMLGRVHYVLGLAMEIVDQLRHNETIIKPATEKSQEKE